MRFERLFSPHHFLSPLSSQTASSFSHTMAPLVIKHATSKYVLKGEDTLTVCEGAAVRLRGLAGKKSNFCVRPPLVRALPGRACPTLPVSRPGKTTRPRHTPESGVEGDEKGPGR